MRKGKREKGNGNGHDQGPRKTLGFEDVKLLHFSFCPFDFCCSLVGADLRVRPHSWQYIKSWHTGGRAGPPYCCGRRKLYLNRTRVGIGAPSLIAGKKCNCRTVFKVASSSPKPAQRAISKWLTSPSLSRSTRTSTVASASARAAVSG